MACFPKEGMRQGGPNPHEFITKVTQELQESRVMRGSRRLPGVAPHPGEDGGLCVCIDYPGLNRVALRSISGLRVWDDAWVRHTAMFACLLACRTRLLLTSVLRGAF